MAKRPSEVGVGKVTLSDEQEKNAKIVENTIDLLLEVEDAGSEEYILELDKESQEKFYEILFDKRVRKHLKYIYSVAGWAIAEFKVRPGDMGSIVTLRH